LRIFMSYTQAFELLSMFKTRTFQKNNFLFLIFFWSVFSKCEDKPKSAITLKLKEADSLDLLLLGKWGGLEGTGYAFEIRRDSFFYPDLNKSFKYLRNGDSINLFFIPEGTLLTNITVHQDTLTFVDSYGIKTFGYRFK